MKDTETPTQSETQADEAENPQPQAGETTPEPQAGEGTTSTDSISLEEAKKLRSESANLRKRLKEAEALKSQFEELKKFKEQIDAEKLTESEKQTAARQKLEQQLSQAQSERENLVRQMQELKINQSVISQAAKLNVVDPEAAIKLLDWSEIDYDDNGNPTNIPDLLKALVKEKPYLVAQQQTRQASSGGATNPSRAQTSGLGAETLVARLNQGQLSSDEYNALPRSTRDEMQKIMSKNIYR